MHTWDVPEAQAWLDGHIKLMGLPVSKNLLKMKLRREMEYQNATMLGGHTTQSMVVGVRYYLETIRLTRKAFDLLWDYMLEETPAPPIPKVSLFVRIDDFEMIVSGGEHLVPDYIAAKLIEHGIPAGVKWDYAPSGYASKQGVVVTSGTLTREYNLVGKYTEYLWTPPSEGE